MCRCRRSHWKFAWVRARALRNTGWRVSSLAASSLKLMACRSRSHERPWHWRQPSCRSRRASSSESPNSWEPTMKPADVRAMTVDQLDDEALKLKKERFNLRFQRATGQLENTARVRQVRRDIARIKTIAAQKRSGKPGRAPAVKS